MKNEASAGASEDILIEMDSSLVEEVASLALRREPDAPYWLERERIYEDRNPIERERRFALLHRAEFDRLLLAAPIREALLEQPIIAREARACRVVRGMGGKDAGAELFVSGGEAGAPTRASRMVVLRIAPSMLLDTASLLGFLRHELQHVADMMDPAFGYDPHPPSVAGGQSRLKIILDRYRVLWDVSIDGRLAQRGHALPGANAARWREFASTFSMLGAQVSEAYARWCTEKYPAHASLMAFARKPCGSLRMDGSSFASTGVCPLCECATKSLAGTDLAPDVLSEVTVDFPGWRLGDGLCAQCQDLYSARVKTRARGRAGVA